MQRLHLVSIALKRGVQEELRLCPAVRSSSSLPTHQHDGCDNHVPASPIIPLHLKTCLQRAACPTWSKSLLPSIFDHPSPARRGVRRAEDWLGPG